MLYQKTFIIPFNTAAGSPVRTQFIIREKIITKIEVVLDLIATKGIVGIKISGGKPDFKVFNFPVDAEDWIRKSELWIGEIQLPEPNLPIDVLGISPGSVKNHLVIISIHTQK